MSERRLRVSEVSLALCRNVNASSVFGGCSGARIVASAD